MRALITGANGDIGYAIVTYLLGENYEVIALDKNINRLQELARLNKSIKLVQVDLSSNDDLLDKYLNNVHEAAFDLVIYAAGIREISSLIDLSLAEWKNVMDVNLTGAFLISKYAVNLAIKNHLPLCVIYISSISGLYGEPQRSAYCASKHGLIGLAKSLAIELAPHGVRVNAISPGIIETELTRPYQRNPQIMQQINSNIPLGRWGQPNHVVQMVDLIIKNDYLTGSALVVDGGWTAGKKL